MLWLHKFIQNFHTFIFKRNMQDVCFGELRSGRERSNSVLQVREERALQVYFLWDDYSCVTAPLFSEGIALAWDLLVLSVNHIQLQNHWCSSLSLLHPVWMEAKTVRSRTEGEQLLSHTAWTSFGQGLTAAIIYAGFFKKSLVCWYHIIEGKKMSFCCSDFWKMPSKMFWEICPK